jgi:hypothetical protein
VLLGNVEAEEPELARLLEQRAHEAGRLRLDRVDVRQDVATDERFGDVGDRAVVGREVLVGEEVADGPAYEEAAAADGAVLDHGGANQQRMCHLQSRNWRPQVAGSVPECHALVGAGQSCGRARGTRGAAPLKPAGRAFRRRFRLKLLRRAADSPWETA